MVSTFTPNVQIEQPARGDDVGTWDTPVNNNMSLIDLLAGGIATISAAAGSVVLSAAQFRSANLTFNSTLAASITVTFPTSFIKPYTVGHLATGSSAFTITLTTTSTATGAQAIALPPGEFVDVFNDGINLKFRNLGRVGSYWDHGGSSVPSWVAGCTVPPYLNCDGTTFSSGTYPQLFMFLGGSTTLPDSRGRARSALNQGTGRMSFVNGNTLFAAGGTDTITLATSQIPSHNHTATDAGHSHSVNAPSNDLSATAGGIDVAGSGNATIGTGFANVSIGLTGGSASHSNTQPTYIGGVTMIRAA